MEFLVKMSKVFAIGLTALSCLDAPGIDVTRYKNPFCGCKNWEDRFFVAMDVFHGHCVDENFLRSVMDRCAKEADVEEIHPYYESSLRRRIKWVRLYWEDIFPVLVKYNYVTEEEDLCEFFRSIYSI